MARKGKRYQNLSDEVKMLVDLNSRRVLHRMRMNVVRGKRRPRI